MSDRDLTRAELECLKVRKLMGRLDAERMTGQRTHALTEDEANFVRLGLRRLALVLDCAVEP